MPMLIEMVFIANFLGDLNCFGAIYLRGNIGNGGFMISFLAFKNGLTSTWESYFWELFIEKFLGGGLKFLTVCDYFIGIVDVFCFNCNLTVGLFSKTCFCCRDYYFLAPPFLVIDFLSGAVTISV